MSETEKSFPILSGSLAGLLSGTVLGLFLLLFSTPLIIKAEKLIGEAPIEMNSRWQGTIIASIILGIVFGCLTAVSLNFLKEKIPQANLKKGLALGLIGFWIFAFWPGIVTPAGLPGTQSEANVTVRQLWWVISITVGAVSLFLPLLKWKEAKSFAGKVGVIVLSFSLVLAVFILKPNFQHSSTSIIPFQMLFKFRIYSLLASFIFWLVLGLATVKLNKKLSSSR